jgi:hypothetical protein
VVIQRVVENGPAAEAGLRPNEVITTIDGEPIDNPRALVELIAQHEPGDTITLTVYQPDEGGEREIEVTLAEHPEKAGVAYLGVMIGAFIRIHRQENGSQSPEPALPDELFRFFRAPFGEWQGTLPQDLFDFRFRPERAPALGRVV